MSHSLNRRTVYNIRNLEYIKEDYHMSLSYCCLIINTKSMILLDFFYFYMWEGNGMGDGRGDHVFDDC